MYHIACTRFTDSTWLENFKYRTTRKFGCIYGSPVPTNEKYSRDSQFFVIEMNNTSNQILGVGLITNTPQKDRTYIIHNMAVAECNYNRYIFKGDKWMGRDNMPTELVEIFEKILFKGKSHLKRIRGISVVTNKLFSRWEYSEAGIINRMKRLFGLLAAANVGDDELTTKTTTIDATTIATTIGTTTIGTTTIGTTATTIGATMVDTTGWNIVKKREYLKTQMAFLRTVGVKNKTEIARSTLDTINALFRHFK